MKHLLKFAIPAGFLFAAFLGSSSVTFAKKAYADKEGKKCVYCHTKAGSKALNEAGKYYKEHKLSLEGFVEKK